MYGTNRKRQLVVLLEALAAGALLAACGGGGQPAGDAAQAEVVAADNGGNGAPVAYGGGSMEAASEMYGDAGAAEPAAAEAQLESAQSLSLPSGSSGYARPKVAAVDYSTDSSTTRQALLAKFRFAIIGARVGSTLTNFTNGIHSRNSSTIMGVYTMFNEVPCAPSSTSFYYPVWQAVQNAKWWLRKADGTISQWTTSYNHCDINLSSWATRDSSGRTWQQYKAQFDYNNLVKIAPYVQYVFTDNNFGQPRVDADWKRIGTNQLRTDSTIVDAQRAGQAAYWSALRGQNSNLKIVGNADSDLSSTQYQQQLNGAFQEGALGKSWSLETWAGWGAMMTRYRAHLKNTTAPHAAFLQAYGATTDYKTMRYGLASALMDNGYFVYLPPSGTLQPSWYDDYEAPIGDPVDGPQTAPKQNGIYLRRYTNGVVLVNPSKTATASIYVGTGYRRLSGTQDPGVNNGQAQSTVTLGPRQGLIMIKG